MMKTLLLLLTIYVSYIEAISNSIHRSKSRYEESDSVAINRKDHVSMCGYDACHPTARGIINVHLIAHTHNDVGWLKTVDQYYYGSNSQIQKAGVQYILDSVVDALMKDPSRKFIYAETYYFQRWWLEQTAEKRKQVKQLVNEGRLEFVGGGWSMNDEASTHYQSIIDQLTWGLRVLNDTFGECGRPKVGWQIDTYGHSREMADLLALSGYDGLFLGRIDYQDKGKRMGSKEMEMIWRGSDDIGAESDLFTGVLYNRYSPPEGFCFDILCSDEPIIDDLDNPNYNVDDKINKFISFVTMQANAYNSNQILITMGDDFAYQNADIWYNNMDKLIKYVNLKEPLVRVMYSSPSCYLKSLNEANLKWPVKQDDFFPYATDEHSFWSGYYTSRPSIKHLERKGNNILQICKQVFVLANLQNEDEDKLNSLRSAMGILQHHDAISGTAKQHVSKDYARILSDGINDCQIIIKKSLNNLMTFDDKSKMKITNETFLSMDLCQLNETRCLITEEFQTFAITVYNPLSHEIDHYVRLPVFGDNYDVIDELGAYTKPEIIPIETEDLFLRIENLKPTVKNRLLFEAVNVPPLGYKSYYVMLNEIPYEKFNQSSQNTIKNDILTVNFDKFGFVENITYNTIVPVTIPFRQEFFYYEAKSGSNEDADDRASGAYVFRPVQINALPLAVKLENTFYKGEKFEEVHQKFTSWATQVIRVYKKESNIQFEWLIGPIPIDNNKGKEIVSRFSTEFVSNGVLFTDSNGRQMIKRIKNKRPTWKLNTNETVSGNFYPVTSMASIKDEKTNKELLIVTDRPQGVASLRSGEIELMIHRRLLHDDNFGVNEALNETVNDDGLIVKGTHYIYFGDSGTSGIPLATQGRNFAQTKLLKPVVFLSPTEMTYEQWTEKRNEFSGIISVPQNVHILTLEPWKDHSILLRLENILPNINKNEGIIVDLNKLFWGIKIKSFRETTLSANQWKDESSRLQWSLANEMVDNFNRNYNVDIGYILSRRYRKKKYNKYNDFLDLKVFDVLQRNSGMAQGMNFEILLKASEIRTFILNVEYLQ